MNKTAKGLLSVLLSLCVLLSVCAPCLAAVSYPDGVTNSNAAQAAQKTDILVKNAVSSLENTTLEELVTQMLFEDETLSQLLLSVYSSLAESSDTLKSLGIDISTSGVAAGLENYPSVKAALQNSAGWAAVDLSKAKWGVRDKYDFACAVAAVLSPFNDVLYTVLCSGTYKVGVIRLNGSNGYETGLVPMLAALGCTWFESSETFYAQSAGNKNSMVWNIVISVFSLLEELLEQPAIKLSNMMPNLAYYIREGGLESSVNALMKPFTLQIGSLVSLFSGSQMLSLLMFIQDPQKYTTDFSENINTVLADMTEQSDVKLAPIDLDTLKSCGTLSSGKVVADIGESFTCIFTWLAETLKLNSDKLDSMLGESEEMSELLPLIKSFLSKSSAEIFGLYVSLLTKEEGTAFEYQWTQKEFTATAVSYTQNLGREKYERVLKGIDSVINDFAVEFGSGSSLSVTLKETIYSGSLLSKLLKGLYGELSGEELSPVLSALGIGCSPSAVAGHLRNSGYYNAAAYLSSFYTWSGVDEERLASCFKSGSREYFEEALVAALMPFEPALEMLLANGTLTVFDALNIPGTNGYNTAVIPLLEALGCPSKHILTQAQYEKQKGSSKIISAITTPLFDLVDKICKKPVYTLTSILPNMIFFVSNGSLVQCLDNLLSPMLELLGQFGIEDLSSFGINLDELKNTDILKSVSDMVPELLGDTMKVEKPDLKSLAGIGSVVSVKSKRTFEGKAQTVYAVKADQPAVLITILRYFVDAIRAPENSDMLGSMMASDDGEADMFSQFSSGIGTQMAEMTTDETIEWLYKLFFRERAVSTTTGAFVYDKAIIYEPQEEESHNAFIIPIVIVLALAVAFVVWRRDRIRHFIEQKKAAKQAKKAANKEA